MAGDNRAGSGEAVGLALPGRSVVLHRAIDYVGLLLAGIPGGSVAAHARSTHMEEERGEQRCEGKRDRYA